MRERLAAAAAAVNDARDALIDAISLRDQLVVTAVDQGMGQRATARAVGVTSGRVCAILADSQNEED